MRLEVEGAAALKKALDEMSDDIRDNVALAVMETASEIHRGVVIKMQQGPHTGRQYKRRGVVHTASAPGEPPAPDRGSWSASIMTEQEGPLTWTVGSRLAYAAYLEYGTTNMAPRPAWTPVLEDQKPLFQGRIEAALRGAT